LGLLRAESAQGECLDIAAGSDTEVDLGNRLIVGGFGKADKVIRPHRHPRLESDAQITGDLHGLLEALGPLLHIPGPLISHLHERDIGCHRSGLLCHPAAVCSTSLEQHGYTPLTVNRSFREVVVSATNSPTTASQRSSHHSRYNLHSSGCV